MGKTKEIGYPTTKSVDGDKVPTNKIPITSRPLSHYLYPIQFHGASSDKNNYQLRKKEHIYEESNNFRKPIKDPKTFSIKTVQNGRKNNKNTSLPQSLQDKGDGVFMKGEKQKNYFG